MNESYETNLDNFDDRDHFADALRDLARSLPVEGKTDNHAVRQNYFAAAASIQELHHLIDMAETYIAGLGKYGEFKNMLGKLEARRK